ncbi:MAG: hypothetical protein MIO92_12255, partial [Methanosarcinaceae archaeon]|nr:hypothetical protein [Methanosarcinaceae archaeon]
QPALVRLICILLAKLLSIPNLTFCVYSAEDRSGPGILRSHLVRIIFTAIRTCTPQAYYPIDAYAQG